MTWTLGLVATTSGHRYMFHAVRTEIATYAPVAGAASGMMSRRRMVNQLLPSTRAASMSSPGRLTRYCRNSRVPKPVWATIGRISPS